MSDKKSRELKKLKNAAKKYCLEPNASELVLKKTGFTPSKTIKLFRDAGEGSLYDYITHLKMLEAKKLLDGTDLNLTSISRAIGYANHKSLRENFIKQFGMYPLNYRNRPKTNDLAWDLFKTHPKLTVHRQTFLLDHIKKHYKSSDLSIQTLSDRFRLTHQEIELIIKHHYRLGLKQLLLDLRLNQAHTKLPNYYKPLRQLAEELGFLDFSYFVAKFEGKYGMGPKRYQQHARL